LLGEQPEPDETDDEALAQVAELYDDSVPEVSTMDERRAGAHTGADRASQRPTSSIEDDSFAHVLVDEAQDLSPMQWRTVSRRGRHASWTIVGDAAQSSWPMPEEAAAAQAEALRGKDQSVFRLSTNYRNSREIFTMAAEFAGAEIPGADLPVAVRDTGVDPVVDEVAAPGLPTSVRSAVEEMGDEMQGTVGVVVPVGWRDQVERWVGERDRERLPVLEALDTKGLEFDGIVLVEPDRIVAEADTGAHTLYVVLTRATQRLHVLGATHHWRP
ncbi:MAG: UvrD-helicase domain-containing protein, partial [Nocardioidaceae bacterium]